MVCLRPGGPQCPRLARNLGALDNHIREAIATVLDLSRGAEDSLDRAYEYRTGDDDLDRAAAELRDARARAREMEQRTADVAPAVATRMPTADIAVLLYISKSRVDQLAPNQSRRRATAEWEGSPPGTSALVPATCCAPTGTSTGRSRPIPHSNGRSASLGHAAQQHSCCSPVKRVTSPISATNTTPSTGLTPGSGWIALCPG